MKTILRGLACCLCAAAPPTVAVAAEQVVLESNAARYPAGQLLAGASPVALAAGEFIVVATEDGRLLRVDGPHAGAATGKPAEPSSVRAALTRLVAPSAPRVGGAGAVRGETPAAQSRDNRDSRPEPWLLHSAIDGEQCVLREQTPAFWREAATGPASIEVTDLASGDVTAVHWNAGEQRAAWPDALAVSDDAIYLVRPSDGLRSLSLRLHVLDLSFAVDEVALAGWLAAKGCNGQAALLLN